VLYKMVVKKTLRKMEWISTLVLHASFCSASLLSTFLRACWPCLCKAWLPCQYSHGFCVNILWVWIFVCEEAASVEMCHGALHVVACLRGCPAQEISTDICLYLYLCLYVYWFFTACSHNVL
jgi:hypothetical protein